LLHLLMRL